jgi:phosphopantothenoylcysteine decarboxylase/phosphopantothenate--cysteine ligase
VSRLLVGVTGSIAAYKAVEAVRLAVRAGHAVRVIQSPNAAHFVGPATFAAITGAPVLSDEFTEDPLHGAYPGEPSSAWAPITHLALAQRADAYLIAPASAATIAALAGGHADSLLTAAALAADCTLLVAPAMNDRMYRHPATQANLATLASRGAVIVGPGSGELASRGEYGVGRMSEPAELLAAVEAVLGDGPVGLPGAWQGRRVLVTAGGTREPIDSVRFIGNRSSGRMGYALAGRAAARGAEVTLVAANVSLPAPAAVRVLTVSTAAELAQVCGEQFADADVLLMAAAVADFRPREPVAHKLKKDDGPPRLELEATPDVLSGLSQRRRPGQVLVGFAAEHGEGGEPGEGEGSAEGRERILDHARAKLACKRLDAVVLNDVARAGIGFDAAENQVTVLAADGTVTELARAAKDTIADGILDCVQALRPFPPIADDHRAHTGRPARV